MEQRIKNYESFIEKQLANKNHSPELIAYHREMLQNFQHERLIHLIITLFFAVLTFAMLPISAFNLSTVKTDWLIAIPCLIATIILVVLTFFYVKHYYFLENHIQKLYDVSRKLANLD